MNRILFYFAFLFLPLVALAAPANDSAANATVLSGTSGQFTITNAAATAGAEDPTGYKVGAAHSVWFKWVAPSSGVFDWSIPTQQGNFGLGLIFCTGNPAATLAIAPKQTLFPYDGLRAAPAHTRISAVSGTTYYILADDLTGTGTVTGAGGSWTTFDAPGFTFDSANAICYRNLGGVFARIARTGTTEGAYTISYTITPLTADPSVIHNFTTGGNLALTGQLTFQPGDTEEFLQIGVDDDGNNVPGETFQITFTVVNGDYLTLGITSTTYAIYENDRFAEAGPISGATGAVQAVLGTDTASVEPGEPIHGAPNSATSQDATVWFDWTAPSSGVFVFYTGGPYGPTAAPFSIYTGASLATLVRVEPFPFSNNSGEEYRQAFTATAGTHYKIGIRALTEGDSGEVVTLAWLAGSTITFSSPTYTVAETDHSINIVLNRTGDLTTSASFEFTTTDGTANQFDYTSVSQFVEFGVGETTKSIPIVVKEDGKHEVAETVNIILSDPESNAYLPTTTALLTITSADTFAARAETFFALLDNGHAVAKKGTVTITTAVGGKFTGKVIYGGKTYSIKGTLDANGSAAIPVTKAGPGQLILNLKSTAGGDRFNVSFTDGTDTTDTVADGRPFDGKNNLAPSFGNYTAKLVAANTATSPGVATISVGLNGTVKIAGSLADGTPFTTSTALAVERDFGFGTAYAPIHIPLYKNGGYLSGEIQCGTDAETPIFATLAWFKPPLAKEKFYPGGVDASVALSASRYIPPTPGTRAFPGLPVNGELSISLTGPGVTGTATAKCYWLINNLVSTGLFTNPNPQLQLKATPSTGLISGKVIVPARTKPLTLILKGVILQGTPELAGFYLDPTSQTSGSITGAP